MKTNWSLGISLVVLCTFLSSFITLPGADSFEVYLDNELLMKDYVYRERSIKPIRLDKNSNATLTVSYSHCGITGSSRSLTLLDDQKKLIREWTFANVDAKVKDPMPVSVKELVTASNGKPVSLYYKSQELDNEVLIAPVRFVDKTTASN